jgi:SM-20-related protein
MIDHHKITQLVDSINKLGFAVIDNFLPADKIALLAAEAKHLYAAGEMRHASTGLASATQNKNGSSLRGDFIHWIDEANSSAVKQEYLALMQTLREALNRTLYLGLYEMESHFAIYPAGSVYHKHSDQFKGNQERQISCILYLNQDWRTQDGGALRLYLNGASEADYRDIIPHGGTLVTFLSGEFLHEVLPASRERISLTGWLRKRSDIRA